MEGNSIFPEPIFGKELQIDGRPVLTMTDFAIATGKNTNTLKNYLRELVKADIVVVHNGVPYFDVERGKEFVFGRSGVKRGEKQNGTAQYASLMQIINREAGESV